MLDRDNYFEESRNFCYPVWLWVGIFFFPFIVSKRTLEVKMIDFTGYIWEISFHSRKFTRGINFIKINLAGRGNGYCEYQFWDISSIRGWGKSFWEMLECFIYERVKGESMSKRSTDATVPQYDLYYWQSVSSNRNLWKYVVFFPLGTLLPLPLLNQHQWKTFLRAKPLISRSINSLWRNDNPFFLHFYSSREKFW